MKIIIAPDSFKGSLSASQVSDIINKSIKKVYSHAETVQLPIGDGGEGTMSALVEATNGTFKENLVTGPLGNQIKASYGVLGDEKTCVVEMACASGLNLIPANLLCPLKATSYGTGQLIKNALADGFKSFIIALGGTASNDGGVGMLQALGANILDKDNNEIGFGGECLNKIDKVNMNDFNERIKNCNFVIASDVNNPIVGPNGATKTFGSQKGATKKEIILLEKGLVHWTKKVEQITKKDICYEEGSGAAGGAGGAFQAFFPNETKQGIEVMLEYVQFSQQLNDADLVITGEGKVDNQTFSGKAPWGIAKVASQKKVPTIIIAGSIEGDISAFNNLNIISANSIINTPMSINEALDRAKELLELSTIQIMRTLFYYFKTG